MQTTVTELTDNGRIWIARTTRPNDRATTAVIVATNITTKGIDETYVRWNAYSGTGRTKNIPLAARHALTQIGPEGRTWTAQLGADALRTATDTHDCTHRCDTTWVTGAMMNLDQHSSWVSANPQTSWTTIRSRRNHPTGQTHTPDETRTLVATEDQRIRELVAAFIDGNHTTAFEHNLFTHTATDRLRRLQDALGRANNELNLAEQRLRTATEDHDTRRTARDTLAAQLEAHLNTMT